MVSVSYLTESMQVAIISQSMPKLRSLQLHGNRLGDVTDGMMDSTDFPRWLCACVVCVVCLIVGTCRGCFSALRVLAINACGLRSFSSLVTLERALPLLEELYASANTLTDMSPVGASVSSLYMCACVNQSMCCWKLLLLVATDPSQFPRLRVLAMSSCGLTSWSQICTSLGALPSLQELLLDCNAIEQLQPQQPEQFCQLRRLSLSSTR